MPKDKNSDKMSLTDQLMRDNSVKSKATKKRKQSDMASDDGFLDQKTSVKILKASLSQQAEDRHKEDDSPKTRKSQNVKSLGDFEEYDDEANEYVAEQDLDADLEADFLALAEDKDEAAENLKKEKELVDEGVDEEMSQLGGSVMGEEEELDPKLVTYFQELQPWAKRYRSGKLPKMFTMIPKQDKWEQMLDCTAPEEWSAACMYMATRMFASNLQGRMAQRFFNRYLLPRLRDDLAEYKKLNYHLYQALKKALFKPVAFYTGIILPLLRAGDVTLQEATIIKSVITNNRIPAKASVCAIYKIAGMEYSGASSIFLRALIDKKYALPYQVIDVLVEHFMRTCTNPAQLPVLWHQCFLTFVERYKEDISSEQKHALIGAIRKQKHAQITPIIRRELISSKCRDVAVPLDQQLQAGSSTMEEEMM